MSCSPPLIGTLQARAFRIAHGIARALGAYVRRYSGWGRRRILLVRNNAISSVPNQTSSGKQHVFLAPTVGGAALAFVLINVVRNHSGSLPNIETDQPLDRSPRPYDVEDRTYAATRLIYWASRTSGGPCDCTGRRGFAIHPSGVCAPKPLTFHPF